MARSAGTSVEEFRRRVAQAELEVRLLDARVRIQQAQLRLQSFRLRTELEAGVHREIEPA